MLLLSVDFSLNRITVVKSYPCVLSRCPSVCIETSNSERAKGTTLQNRKWSWQLEFTIICGEQCFDMHGHRNKNVSGNIPWQIVWLQRVGNIVSSCDSLKVTQDCFVEVLPLLPNIFYAAGQWAQVPLDNKSASFVEPLLVCILMKWKIFYYMPSNS